MAKDDERRSFPARTAAWEQVRAFVESRSAALRVPRGAALRLELIAEELFINAAEHGHAEDGRLISLGISDVGDEVELVIEDGAGAFDPFAGLQDPTATGDPSLRPVGGLGRNLVAGLSSRRGHERLSTGNRVTVAVRKDRNKAHGPR